MNKLNPGEEKMKAKMEGFAPEPPPVVWEQVNSSIQYKRKWRPYCLLAGMLLLLTGLAYLTLSRNENAETIEETSVDQHANNTVNNTVATENMIQPESANNNVPADHSVSQPSEQSAIENLPNSQNTREAAKSGIINPATTAIQSNASEVKVNTPGLSGNNNSATGKGNLHAKTTKVSGKNTATAKPDKAVNNSETVNSTATDKITATEKSSVTDKNTVPDKSSATRKISASDSRENKNIKAENVQNNGTALSSPDQPTAQDANNAEITQAHATRRTYQSLVPLSALNSFVKSENVSYAPSSVTLLPLKKMTRERNRPFSVELYAGVGFPVKSLSYSGSDQAYYAKYKQSEKPWYTISAGMNTGYHFTRRLAVYTGIDYLQVVENFNSVNTNKMQYLKSPNQYGLDSGWYRGIETTRGDIRYTLYSIPLQIGYRIGNGNWIMEPRLGVLYNFHSYSEGFIVNPDGALTKREKNKTPLNKLQLGYSAALNIEYRPGPSFGIFLRPQWTWFPTKFDFKDQELKTGLNLPDIRVGSSYRF